MQGLRRVHIPTEIERDDRRLAALRHRNGRETTRIINSVRTILRRRNLQHDCPTKTIQAKRTRVWLDQLELAPLDRLELNQLLARWDQLIAQRTELEAAIAERVAHCPAAQLLRTLPSVGPFMALGLWAHIGDIQRFARPRSLANYWGLTPGCHNSGESGQRLGGITKQGSTLARFLLGQLVMFVLKRDGKLRHWYLNIKRRRGAKIAHVAVMRRLATIIWHMLTHQEDYASAGRTRASEKPSRLPRSATHTVQSRRGGRDQQDPQFPSPAPPSPFPSSLIHERRDRRQTTNQHDDKTSVRSPSSDG